MEKYKLNIILLYIGIIIISIFMMYSTYAYFSVNVSGEGKDIKLSTFDQNTTIKYTDTSNVSMVNAYTGDEIIKTFSIENTSNLLLHYDIIFNNVVNNFENKEDLVYKLESNNAALRELSIIPDTDEKIASDILIEPHKKHDYKLTITFLNKDTDQSANMNKTFSSNILVKGSENINVGQKIYKENTLLQEIISLSMQDDKNVFLTNNSNDGKPIYYYKGKDIDNNLIYNNMCFKIIRTDTNYGIRLLYNGEYIDGVCSNQKYIAKTKFNINSNSNAYVGYMYGNASSNNYNNEHVNLNNSNIKNTLDEWYKEKFNGIENISNSSIYCNYRKINSFTLNGVLYSKSGFGKNNTGYFNINDGIKSFKCDSINDSFSVSNTNSNNKLEYPVGLISADEVLYSGEESYLYGMNYWTITPAYFNGSDAYNYVVSNSNLLPVKVNAEYYVRPVITLDKDIVLLSGFGSIEDPYIVK